MNVNFDEQALPSNNKILKAVKVNEGQWRSVEVNGGQWRSGKKFMFNYTS